MQKIFKSFLSLILAVAVCVSTAVFLGASQSTVAVADAGTYYNGITATSGTTLSGQLHDLIVSTHKKYTSYSDVKTYAETTDPGSKSNTVMEFYTQIDITTSNFDNSGGWNREHVWPQSDSGGLWGTTGAGSDLHHIRPAEKDLNNHRGNLLYGTVGTSGTKQYTSVSNVLGGYSNSNTFEPLDNVKGDVARIVMYVYLHYNNASNVGGTKEASATRGTLKFTQIIKASNEEAAKKLLLEWNKSDPVDQIEKNRNEAVYKIQGNRNPFIDNSSYAEAIWGNGSVIDPGPGIDPTPSNTLKSISLNATALTLTAGDTYNLTVTPNPASASASVTWASSDTSVATVSNGKVTANSAGTATITATSTVDASIKATATVTVLAGSTSGTSNGKSVITIGSFGRVGSYGFYTWNTDDISGIAFITANDVAMQFNKSKNSYYLASTSPTPAPIKSVTVKSSDESPERPWKLLTSTTPYGEVKGKPDNGTDHGTKTVTADGVTWTLNGNDTCFALTYELDGTAGAAYLEEIVVDYSSGNSSGNTDELQNLYINPSAFSLQEGASTKLTVASIPASAGAEVTWTSSNPSVATVSSDGTVTAIKAGTATITATSTSNSAITATATVTVTEEPFVSGSANAIAFHNAVSAINVNGTFTEFRTTINVAVNAYKNLSEADKTEVSADIAKLNVAIALYNEVVKACNGAADDAAEPALKGAGRFV